MLVGHLALHSSSKLIPVPRFRSVSRGLISFKCYASTMATDTVKIAAAQMTSVNDLSANFNTCSRLVKEAAAAGAKLLCFPEIFSFVSAKDGESLKIAETLDGPIMQGYCSLARESNIWLSLGGFQEKGPDDAHLYNTHVLVDDSGNIRSIYRKIHLFDVDVPGGMVYKESSFTTAGNNIVVEDTPFGRLGLTVCYDLRFPELYQQLRFQHQAQVLLVPAAFTRVTGEAHWEILLRARAIETQCYEPGSCTTGDSLDALSEGVIVERTLRNPAHKYISISERSKDCIYIATFFGPVIAPAQAGRHNEKRESYGDTLVIDPWGKIVARLPDRQATGIVVADIDFSVINSVRSRMPLSEHRKPNGYWKPYL